jgi:hypothetical protein
MSDVLTDNAREWANDLIRRESRGPGDLDGAMRRLEARYGIPATTFWRLRHGRVKEIFASTYVRLQAAYIAECERQTRILKTQAEIAKAKGLSASPVVVEIEALDCDEAV